MTKEAFRAFCEEWRAKGALDFTQKSHYEDMSQLLEAHAEVVVVKKSDFHPLSGGQFYPMKQTTDRISRAGGVSFLSQTKITIEADKSWTCTAFPTETGPDGHMITKSPASYNFNPEDRAEEEILRKVVKDGTPMPSPEQMRLKVLEYKKVALRRADTGARTAAIISVLSLPTGFKNLFTDRDGPEVTKIFLFSRVIWNTKNEMVLSRALDAAFGAVAQIAGPEAAITMENAIDQNGLNTTQPTGEVIRTDFEVQEDFDDFGAGEAFGSPEHIEVDPREEALALLKKIRADHANDLPQEGKDIIDRDIAGTDPKAKPLTLIRIQGLINQCRDILGKHGIKA